MTAPVLAAGLLLAPAVPADAPSSSFRLAWVRGAGADGCIDERELERGVRSRLGRDPFMQDAAQNVEGDIVATAGGFRAELRVRDAKGALVGHRVLDVSASDCKKLTDALVLAIALVIEPRAPLSEPAVSAGAPGGPPESAPAESKSDESRRATDDPPQTSPPPTPCPAPPLAPVRACPVCKPRACPEPARSHVVAHASLRALGAAGILPNLAPGIGLNVSAGLRGARLRFTAGMSYYPEQETSLFAFGLSTVNLGACVDASAIGRWTPSLCAQLQAGAMHAVVRELVPLRPGDHFWAAVGLGPEVYFRPLGALVLQASLLGVVPVRRPEFAVRGDSGIVFESKTLGAVGSVGVGIVIP